jgi:hypothetical protein
LRKTARGRPGRSRRHNGGKVDLNARNQARSLTIHDGVMEAAPDLVDLNKGQTLREFPFWLHN